MAVTGDRGRLGHRRCSLNLPLPLTLPLTLPPSLVPRRREEECPLYV
jgi:hypothetical protein